MDVLHHADRWELLRLGIGAAAHLSSSSGGMRLCKLCGGSMYGMPHILAVCPALEVERNVFLVKVGTFYANRLRGAPAGDWPTVVLSPHADLVILRQAVIFGGAIMDHLQTM